MRPIRPGPFAREEVWPTKRTAAWVSAPTIVTQMNAPMGVLAASSLQDYRLGSWTSSHSKE